LTFPRQEDQPFRHEKMSSTFTNQFFCFSFIF